FSFFFFQAEDGIRDFHVTGVQTCALPIWPLRPWRGPLPRRIPNRVRATVDTAAGGSAGPSSSGGEAISSPRRIVRRPRGHNVEKIGRASCRERVEVSVVAFSVLMIRVCAA